MSQYVVPDLKRTLKRVIRSLGAAACVLTSAAALAVEAPYTENFDSYPTDSMPNNFSTETTGAGIFFTSQWSIQNATGSAGVYRNNAAGDFVSTSAAVNVTNLAQSDFLLSTSFMVNSYGAFTQTLTDIRVGLNALASSPNLSSTGYQLSYELLDNGNSFSTNGALQIYRAGQVFAGFPFVTLPVALGTTYTMTLMGTYSPKGLLLTGTLNDGSSSISLAAIDPTPQQGTYFGYHDSASGLFNHAAYVDVSYDNFSITVPEPRIIWFFGLGILIFNIRNSSRRRI